MTARYVHIGIEVVLRAVPPKRGNGVPNGAQFGSKMVPVAQSGFKLDYVGTKLAFCWPKGGWRGLKLAPRWRKLVSRMPQDGPSWRQDGPRTAQVGAKLAPRWAKWGPRQPRLGPAWLQVSPNAPKLLPSCPQVGPKLAPIWHEGRQSKNIENTKEKQ